MQKITIYEKSTCSKCRQTEALLNEKGLSFDVVHYHDTPISTEKLKELLAKMDMKPIELFRKGEEEYKAMKEEIESADDARLIAILVSHPALMQRPIIEVDDKAVLGRPPENVLGIL